MNGKNAAKITNPAIFVALIAISAQIAIPMPHGVSMTMQTFAVALCGFCLPVVQAAAACVVYILLGAIGIPIFSSFSGGPGILFGKSGGYILGFVFISTFCSLSEKAHSLNVQRYLFILGVVLCHILGLIYLSLYAGVQSSELFAVICCPYLIKDIALLFVAKYFSLKLRKHLRI